MMAGVRDGGLSGFPLCDRVRALADTALAGLPPGAARDAVAEARERLDGRALRIAVGGRVNAGKSTLVNALLGQRLAATGAVETTTVAVTYRHHHQNRVTLHLKDGSSMVVAGAPGGGLPAELPVPVATVDRAVVDIAGSWLGGRYEIVDTPGLDSLTGLDAASMAALAEADALLYVMPHPGDRDREALEALRGTSAPAGLTAANAIGVLSRIDTLGDGAGDPWPAARRVAGRYARELRGLVAAVVPVVGLLAETATGAELTERDLRLLRAVADAGPDAAEDALDSAAGFLGWHDGPLPETDRARLLRLFDVYGLRLGVALARAGVTRSDDVLARLTTDSGVGGLVAHIDRYFVRSADRLRAASVVAALDRAAWADDALRGELNRFRREPAMRQVALTGALTDLAERRLAPADDEAAALVDLATGDTDRARLGLPADASAADLRAAAEAWTGRWRRLEGGPGRLLARHARTAREMCEEVYFNAGTVERLR